MTEIRSPVPTDTHVSERRYVAHFVDGTLFTILYVLAIVLVGSVAPDHTFGDVLLIEYFYVIALISMLTSDFRQRLGDRWGDTYVVDG